MTKPLEDRKKIRALLSAHNQWRSSTLNLIASENLHSPLVRAALDSDLLSRYASYQDRDLASRKYCGGKFVVEIEQIVYGQVLRVFHTKYAELRPISGHMAGLAVIAALCRAGDVLLELGRDGGGHRQATRQNLTNLIPLDIDFIPFDGNRYNIDLKATKELIIKRKPQAIILGSSSFLFPHPVREIKDILLKTSPQTLLIYDASHVMGFLGAGEFQDPLTEGADVVFGSTHKTLPGPQGGIVFTDQPDLIEKISTAVYPALVTSHHVYRMPALGLALAEIEKFGKSYVKQIVTNAQALGDELAERGISCVNVDGKYTLSHTLLIKVAEFGRGTEVADILEQVDIIAGKTTLPNVHGTEGIRIGVQEITRRGAKEDHMPIVAGLISDAIRRKAKAEKLISRVHEFTKSLGPIQFTWEHI